METRIPYPNTTPLSEEEFINMYENHIYGEVLKDLVAAAERHPRYFLEICCTQRCPDTGEDLAETECPKCSGNGYMHSDLVHIENGKLTNLDKLYQYYLKSQELNAYAEKVQVRAKLLGIKYSHSETIIAFFKDME